MQNTLPVMFGARENIRTKYMHFEVADFKMAYNAYMGRPALTKFMVVPHYAYLVLKLAITNGVVSIKEDVKRAYDYDLEGCEMVDILLEFVEP
jgi:hypothetical protein